MNVKIHLIDDDAKVPKFAHKGDACADLYVIKDVYVPPGETEIAPLGFQLELAENTEAIIRPRSGLSKKGILVHIGTIDGGYRGEVGVIISNISKHRWRCKKGDRIAQLAIRCYEDIVFVEVEELGSSDRGECGFGSTGK